jgi:ubiquitin-conjugating enzyme E2 S
MTSIHARIPATLRQEVDTARRRGEEDQSSIPSREASIPAFSLKSRLETTFLRKKLSSHHPRPSPLPLRRDSAAGENQELSDDEEDHDPSKENDPSQSPIPVIQSPRSPRKNVLGKRPLSELPTPTEPEEGMTESEKNIAVNQLSQSTNAVPSGPPKKSPRLAIASDGANASFRLREEPFDRPCSTGVIAPSADEEKENVEQTGSDTPPEITKIPIRAGNTSDPPTTRPTLRKVSNLTSSKAKPQPRIGIRRL